MVTFLDEWFRSASEKQNKNRGGDRLINFLCCPGLVLSPYRFWFFPPSRFWFFPHSRFARAERGGGWFVFPPFGGFAEIFTCAISGS